MGIIRAPLMNVQQLMHGGVTLLVSDQLLLKGFINFIQSLQKSKASFNTGRV